MREEKGETLMSSNKYRFAMPEASVFRFFHRVFTVPAVGPKFKLDSS